MDRATFGKLVQILRKERWDEHRKVWTQKMLQQKANLSKRTIERIENGTLQKLDARILLNLANAFELTTMERKEFFFAAIGVKDDKIMVSHTDSELGLDALLERMKSITLPMFLNDVYGDIIAANKTIIRLLDIPSDLIRDAATIPAGHNIMRIIFSADSNFRNIVGSQWDTSARHNIQFFRGISLRYRTEPYFDFILSSLRKYKLFRTYWEQAVLYDDDSSADNVYYDYDHPTHGRLRYLANISTISPKAGGLYLVLYIPSSAHTSSVFSAIGNEVGADIVRFAPWPQKDFPQRVE